MSESDAQEKLKPVLGPATQLGFVVRNLDAAVNHWTGVLGFGPFLHFDKGTGRPPAPSLYRGEEVVVETRLAFGYVGDVQVELIEQVNDAPSPYRDFLAAGREGLQHLGYWVPDFQEACRRVEAGGYEPEFVIPIVGQPDPIIYYRSPDLIGLMLEISPPRWQHMRQAVFEKIKAHSGSQQLIKFDTYGDFVVSANVTFS
ncbi:VOC family protein [Corticibacterium sp. UT-5YL-CI-8]|nr:VOC family protein [Tianweitania sp. UT-5YL-CI-8]